MGDQFIGGYFSICSLQHGEDYLTSGPDRLKFLVCFVIVNCISAALLLVLNKDAQTFFLVHFVILIFLDITWLCTALINPGILKVEQNEEYPCPFCLNPNADLLMSNSDHCRKCGICIEGRMHHCVIAGGCIGKYNMISYYFFILGAFLWSIDFLATLPYAYYLS